MSIIAVVIGEMAVYELLKTRGKPKININALCKFGKLGFSVSVEKKMVKDARVRCNNISYDWETLKDKNSTSSVSRKDLHVGDTPSTFFPYQVTMEFMEDFSKYLKVIVPEGETEFIGAISIKVAERTTLKTVYDFVLAIPTHTTWVAMLANYTREPAFVASIRLIGEGIEEVRDYACYLKLKRLNIPIKEGKPVMDYISYSFELKKRSRFR